MATEEIELTGLTTMPNAIDDADLSVIHDTSVGIDYKVAQSVLKAYFGGSGAITFEELSGATASLASDITLISINCALTLSVLTGGKLLVIYANSSVNSLTTGTGDMFYVLDGLSFATTISFTLNTISLFIGINDDLGATGGPSNGFWLPIVYTEPT